MPKASNLRLSDLILQTNAIHRTCRQGTPASDPSPHGRAIGTPAFSGIQCGQLQTSRHSPTRRLHLRPICMPSKDSRSRPAPTALLYSAGESSAMCLQTRSRCPAHKYMHLLHILWHCSALFGTPANTTCMESSKALGREPGCTPTGIFNSASGARLSVPRWVSRMLQILVKGLVDIFDASGEAEWKCAQ